MGIWRKTKLTQVLRSWSGGFAELTALFLVLGPLLATAQPASQESLRVDVELVQVPVVVIDDENDRLLTGLTRENFIVLEDGVRQPISTFSSEAAPLTMVLLLEYSGRIRAIRGEVLRPAGIFVSQIMGPEDYAAVVAYDMRPEILSDFTQNRQQLLDAVNTLVRSPPGMNESNLFDALKFVLTGGVLGEVDYKGLAEVEGRTGVLLIASGLDTFSRINFDDARDAVARAGVPIYAIGIGKMAYTRLEPYLSGAQRMTFLQGQSFLRTFAEASGGRFYSVRFQGALDSVLESIAAMLRHQYVLGYNPGNPAREGERRTIEVLVDVDADGQPDKEDITVQHRESYLPPNR